MKLRMLVLGSGRRVPPGARGWAGERVVVGECGDVVINGDAFVFQDPDEALDPGTEVQIMLARQLCCAPVAEVDALQREMNAKVEAARDQSREKLRRQVEEAKAFNDGLRLPFKWRTGRRILLIGLGASSWGNGANSRTVMHVMLDEAISIGRLKRAPGEFLCSTDTGKFEGDEAERAVDGAKVTCAACLKVAARLKR